MKILISWCFIFIIAAPAIAQEHQVRFPGASTPLVVDSLRQEVRVLAVYHPGKFSGFLRFVPNYHLLVWDDGRAAREALFSTPVPDTTLIAALESVGAIAGNNLTMDAWDKRNDPKHPAPQTHIAGTPVEILVWWKELSEPKPLAELLDDPGSRGLDFRFGGNRDLIHHWHSGCLVCLYSCPGSKVGNAAYTVRDYATGATKFSPRKERLPKSESEVVLILRLRD
ncbi:YdjY domain-containing protein [candidate division KSB1 bacterium]|nr:YdjY domain-containing protein [candidate division KSB1 bacterium]